MARASTLVALSPTLAGAPTASAVRALEDAAVGARIEGGGGLGVDSQGLDSEVRQPRVDSVPVRPAVGALEDASPSACAERGGGLRIAGQSPGIARPGPAVGPPASPGDAP